jgi:hypothetical protein
MALSDVTTRIYELQVRLSQESLAALKKLNDQVGDATKSLENFKSMASGALSGLMAGASIGAFMSAIQDTISGLDELADTAARLGQSPASFSEMAYAAQLADVEVGELATGMKELNKAVFAAGKEGSKENAIFKALGIDPTGKDTTKVMEEIADSFNKIGDEAAKNQVLLELFGKAGLAMRPMMEQGAEGIRTAREEASAFGIVLTDELAAAIGEYDTNTKKLKASTQGLMTEIVKGLLPAITAIQEAFLDAGKSGADFTVIGKAIGAVFKFIAGAVFEAWQIFTVMGKSIGALAAAAAALLSGNFKSIPDIFSAWKEDMHNVDAETTKFYANMKKTTPAVKDETKAIEADAKMTKELTKAMQDHTKERSKKDKKGIVDSLISDTDTKKLADFDKKIDEIQKALDTGFDTNGMKLTAVQLKALAEALEKTTAARAKFVAAGGTREKGTIDSLISDTDLVKLDNFDKKIGEIIIALETGWDTNGVRLTALQIQALGVALDKTREARDKFVKGQGTSLEDQVQRDIDKFVEAEDAAQQYAAQLLTIAQLETDPMRAAQAMELYDKVTNAGKDAADQNKQTLTGMDALLKQIEENTDQYAQSVSASLVDIATSSDSAKDAFAGFVETTLKGMAEMAVQAMVVKPLFDALRNSLGGTGGSLASLFSSAQGSVWSGGRALAFAGGGIVSGPTLFPMASGGAGLMGEAGPEAIMPLTRTSTGELGVKTQGNAGTVVIIENYGAQVKTEETKSPNGQDEIRVIVESTVEQGIGKGRYDRVMSQAYGVQRKGR